MPPPMMPRLRSKPSAAIPAGCIGADGTSVVCAGGVCTDVDLDSETCDVSEICGAGSGRSCGRVEILLLQIRQGFGLVFGFDLSDRPDPPPRLAQSRFGWPGFGRMRFDLARFCFARFAFALNGRFANRARVPARTRFRQMGSRHPIAVRGNTLPDPRPEGGISVAGPGRDAHFSSDFEPASERIIGVVARRCRDVDRRNKDAGNDHGLEYISQRSHQIPPKQPRPVGCADCGPASIADGILASQITSAQIARK